MILKVALALVSITYLCKRSPVGVQFGDDVRFLLLFIATDDHQTIAYSAQINKHNAIHVHVIA